jgi:carboxyl-terminal processing protease
MMSMVYKNGTQRTDYVEVIPPSEDVYDECTVSEQDIGKYSSYDFVVLTNRYTASSAELFAANIRDHELGTLIGETTYGKGCVQRTYNLDYFGIEGALKLTIAWYAPPCGENYHGVGITPDVAVETDKALIEQYGSIYLVPDEQDPQIRAAIEALNQ